MSDKHINELSREEARKELLRCCGSSKWADMMVDKLPFASREEMLIRSDDAMSMLTEEDWLEAFAHHPKIGDLEALKKKFQDTSDWCEGEQSSVSEASEAVLHELHDGNIEYEKKFGFIFIVFATGKTASEMLEILKTRLQSSRATEIHNASMEQRRITALRLEKLCQEALSQHTS